MSGPCCLPQRRPAPTVNQAIPVQSGRDQVQWDEEQEAAARRAVAEQASAPADAETAARLLDRPHDNWEAFYMQHNNKLVTPVAGYLITGRIR